MAEGQLTPVLQHLRKIIGKQGAGGLSDEQLLNRFIDERDEAAFEVLMWRHGPMVLSLCKRVLPNEHDAEDVLQATFLILVRKARSIGKRESLASWLYKAAYRIALRAKSTAAKHVRDERQLDKGVATDPADEAAWKELRPLLDVAIDRLSEKYRVPIILCYLQGKTNREAAEQLGCPIGTVCARLARAREQLRRELARHGVTLSAALLGDVLVRKTIAAVVSPRLAAETVRTALVYMTGKTATSGAISAKVVALVEGASRAMFLTKSKVAAVLVLAGLVCCGVGALSSGAFIAGQTEPPKKQEPEKPLVEQKRKVLDNAAKSDLAKREKPRSATKPGVTVDGPEATDLIKRVTGTIVMHGAEGGIVAVSLPAVKETVVLPVRANADGYILPSVYTLAGPDATGRIVYIEEPLTEEGKERHLLKTIKLNGKEQQEVFSRPKDALWSHAVGQSLALARMGGRAAFVSDLKGIQMDDPPALLEAGALEIWDVVKKTGRKVGPTALDAGLSWFPDGKRLVYVELVLRQNLPKGSTDLGDFGAEFKTWDRVPCVYVFDVDANKKTFLHIGWQPVVSSDGKTVLLYDAVQAKSPAARLVNVSDGKSKVAKWPGDSWQGAVALLDGDLVLYRGLPTTGSPARYTEHNSPVAGAKRMITLKVAQINSQRFQTVVPYVDPRSIVSFGH